MINIIKEYVQATNDYEDRVNKLNNSLVDLHADNYIISTIPDLYVNNRDNLLNLVIGDYNLDWLMWYMYEKGQKPSEIWIDGVKHTISSLEDLVSICFEKTYLDYEI